MSDDAVVIGSGPNGLAAAIVLARAGLSVSIYEAKPTVGGGMRTAELTLPGFFHDVCSAVHPLGVGSPFFNSIPLNVSWIQPSAPLAHPFSDGTAILLERSIESTKKYMNSHDACAYENLMEPFVTHWDKLSQDLLAPFHFPAHPYLMGRFGFYGVRSAQGLERGLFQDLNARSLFAGLAAHSILPLAEPLTAAFGIILGTLGHACGWPFAKGGSQKIADALASYFLSLGGKIHTNRTIEDLNELPPSKIIMCDVSPKQLLKIAGNRLPLSYRQKLEKYRYGPGVFKVDWALHHPIPWKAKECLRAGTVHVCGSEQEIILSEQQVWKNRCSEHPFVILAQPSLFDPSRSPPGKQTAWAYCHVPNGSTIDMTETIENQIERFAPGFKDCIFARSTKSPLELEEYNSNYIGGDINGGVQDFYQLFTRPTARWVPYSTPLKNLYLCSASTPPGGGVHGMCGYHAAQAALSNFDK